MVIPPAPCFPRTPSALYAGFPEDKTSSFGLGLWPLWLLFPGVVAASPFSGAVDPEEQDGDFKQSGYLVKCHYLPQQHFVLTNTSAFFGGKLPPRTQ